MPLPSRQGVDTSATVAVVVAVAEVVLLQLPDSPPVLLVEVFFGHQRSHIIVPSSLARCVGVYLGKRVSGSQGVEQSENCKCLVSLGIYRGGECYFEYFLFHFLILYSISIIANYI